MAFQAGDFTDADCNAANAASVDGAMRGRKGILANLVAQIHDRTQGPDMDGVPITPPVDESITEVAKRSAAIGRKLVAAHGGKVDDSPLRVTREVVIIQAAELFQLSDLTHYWKKDWRLVHAGFVGTGGGMKGLRGNTCVNGERLATYPGDEVRATYLTRALMVGAESKLRVEVAADKGRVWQLKVFREHKKLLSKLIEGGTSGMTWQSIELSLSECAGKNTVLRMYQRVLVPERVAGNAYWRNSKVE